MKCWRRFSCDFDDALLPQSNHRRHCVAPAHLVSDCDPAYHLSRVNESIKAGHEAEACGHDVRPPAIIAIVGPQLPERASWESSWRGVLARDR